MIIFEIIIVLLVLLGKRAPHWHWLVIPFFFFSFSFRTFLCLYLFFKRAPPLFFIIFVVVVSLLSIFQAHVSFSLHPLFLLFFFWYDDLFFFLLYSHFSNLVHFFFLFSYIHT